MSLAIDAAPAFPSPRVSSLRVAFLTMALLPAGSACLIALGAALLAPSAEMVAGVAVALFALNALALPLLLDRRISSRLAALADALRAARDGHFERMPTVVDHDAIGDIARLANDIVAAQADIGRYAMSLHNAEEFARISDAALQRLAGGAQQIDRTLAGFQAAANNVSRSSERIAASLDAAAIGTDETTRNFVNAASRAIRSAEAIVLSLGRASLAVAPPLPVSSEDRAAPLAIDAVLIRLDGLAQSVSNLPNAAQLRQISEAATVPLLGKLSDLSERTLNSLSDLQQPIAAGRGAIEARLDDLQDWLATTPQHSATPPAEAAIDLAPVTEAIARLESEITARLSAQPDVAPNPPAAPALDLGPFADSIDRLERRLIQLSERPAAASDPVDLEPVLTGLADIAARLSTIEQPAVADATPHPDAGLVAEFDAARAPLQRLLVAFRLAVRDIGLESGRLRSTIDDIAVPSTETAEPPLDLSPLAERLDEIAARIGALEITTQQSIGSRPAHPDAGLVAEFDAAKAPLQRILAGLRLALREIADSSSQFRDAVGQIGAQPSVDAAAVATPAIDLSPIAAQLDDLTQRFASLEIAARLAINTPAPASTMLDSKLLPQMAIDRTAMSTALTGLKLMMREISADATALRSAADAMPSKGDIVAPAVDLSAITGPLGALREELAAGNSVLAEIYAQMGRDTETPNQVPTIKVDPSTPSLATTLSLMSAFSSAVETKFDDIERRIFEVTRRYGTADGRGAAEDLVTRLLDAAAELRDQVGRFLAVGAALSREIETAGKEQKSSHPEAPLPRLSQRNK